VTATKQAATAFALGTCIADPARNELRMGDRAVHLEPRVMDVLRALAERPDRVVSRTELIDSVWGQAAGSDEALSRAISLIRRALSELGIAETYIQTVPKRGYTLRVPVARAEAGPPPVRDRQTPPPAEGDAIPSAARPRMTRPIGLMLVGAALAVLLIAVLSLRPGDDQRRADGGPAAAEITLAVLPFVPFSDEPRDQDFSYGITEELLNALAGVPELAVAARTSSFQYEGQAFDVRRIGAALGVDYVVEGSVRRSGDRVRVTVQLIRTRDGFHVWSGVEEGAVGRTFALQDEIVGEVARALELRLGVGVGRGARPAASVDPRAAEYYYEGLHAAGNALSRDGAAEAAYDALRTAVEIDPDFPEARIALADLGVRWASGPFAKDKERFVGQLRDDIEQALRLAPDDYRAHVAASQFFGSIDLDVDAARRHVERAEALAPNAVPTLNARAWHDWLTGRPEAAIEGYRRAAARDPNNLTAQLALALKQAQLGDAEAAFAFLDACEREACLGEGFVAYAAAAAVMAGDAETRARWSAIYDAFERQLADVPEAAKPDVVKINPAYFSVGFGQDDAAREAEALRARLSEEDITNHIGFWAPALARSLPEETVLRLLDRAHARGDLFSAPFALSAFYGANPYPERILRHPDYAALWAAPELARLAAIRRSNGWSDGLPPAR
jgi:TolB-like protein/DNA-binding winged helix-turn-helix (wHTH) protein/Tfp pilus assembly protein PilF